MKRTAIGYVALGCVLIFGAYSANAQVPSHMVFDVEGTSNFMVSPVLFVGNVTGGEPLLLTGYWDIQVDDTGWPADTDKQARWDHIAATYYLPNYDPFVGNWTATFDENTTASAPWWQTGRAGVGNMTGTATLQLTMLDFDLDGVIDTDERSFLLFSGTLIVVKNGEGVFAGFCGLGSYSGSANNPDPANWANDNFTGSNILDVEDCAVPVKEVSWGHIKSIYQ
jgi:hypothetical protein